MRIKNIVLYIYRYLASPEKYARYIGVKIGNNCLIETRNWSSEPYLISIGDNVQITNGVHMHTHGGANAIRYKYPDFDCFGKIVIEDWAYIGAHSQIMPGCTIGSGAIVAAGSVVTKSVAPHTVVGGNPAHYICTTEEYYNRNVKFDIGTKRLSAATKKKIIFSLPKDKFITK